MQQVIPTLIIFVHQKRKAQLGPCTFQFNNVKTTYIMNTHKVKAFRFIKRLAAIAKKQTQRKSSQTSKKPESTQPCINQLYSIDFVHNGTLQKNVTGRYAGLSKSGKFMKFELASFFTLQGIRIHLLCLDKLPLKLLPLKQNLLTVSKAA